MLDGPGVAHGNLFPIIAVESRVKLQHVTALDHQKELMPPSNNPILKPKNQAGLISVKAVLIKNYENPPLGFKEKSAYVLNKLMKVSISCSHVPLKETEDGHTVMIDVKDTAKCLHISEAAVRKLAKEGNLEPTLKKVAEGIGENYKAMINNYRAFETEAAKFRAGPENNFKEPDEQLMTDTLLKVVAIALQEIPRVKKDVMIVVNKRRFFVRLEKGSGGKLEIIPTNQLKLIGEGGFSNVFASVALTTGEKTVIKAAKFGKPGAALDAANAQKKLSHINTDVNGKKISVWGIQESPKIVTNFKKLEFSGSIEKKSDSDLVTYISQTNPIGSSQVQNSVIDQKLVIMHQLLSGLNRLKTLEIAHFDIKPNNILIKKVKDHFIAEIADFGGTFDYSDLTKSKYNCSYTPRFMPLTDYKAIKPHLKNPKRFTKSQVVDRQLIAGQIDVFAMGVTLYVLFAGCFPFKCGEDNHPKITKFTHISENIVPAEIDQLLEEMLKPTAHSRIDSKLALEKLNNYIKTHRPHLVGVINELKQQAGKVDG